MSRAADSSPKQVEVAVAVHHESRRGEGRVGIGQAASSKDKLAFGRLHYQSGLSRGKREGLQGLLDVLFFSAKTTSSR